jgi:hypothetical protein
MISGSTNTSTNAPATDDQRQRGPQRDPERGLGQGQAVRPRRQEAAPARRQQDLHALPGEAERQAEEATPAPAAEREPVHEAAHARVGAIGRQGRVLVRVLAVDVGVGVVDLVVPGLPQPRRHRERQEGDPAEHAPGPATAGDRAMQQLVADEGQAGEGHAVDHHQRGGDRPAAKACGDREGGGGGHHQVRRDEGQPPGRPRQRRRR